MTMDISRERRREIIAALRKGTVPQRGLDFLAVGLNRFEPVMAAELCAATVRMRELLTSGATGSARGP